MKRIVLIIFTFALVLHSSDLSSQSIWEKLKELNGEVKLQLDKFEKFKFEEQPIFTLSENVLCPHVHTTVYIENEYEKVEATFTAPNEFPENGIVILHDQPVHNLLIENARSEKGAARIEKHDNKWRWFPQNETELELTYKVRRNTTGTPFSIAIPRPLALNVQVELYWLGAKNPADIKNGVVTAFEVNNEYAITKASLAYSDILEATLLRESQIESGLDYKETTIEIAELWYLKQNFAKVKIKVSFEPGSDLLDQLNIRLPPEISIINIDANSPIEGYEKEKNGIIKIKFAYPQNQKGYLLIDYEQKYKDSTNFTLMSSNLIGFDNIKSTICIMPSDTVSVALSKLSQMKEVKPSSLSREIWELADHPITYSLLAEGKDAKAQISIQSFSSIDLVSTVIEKATAASVISEQGTTSTKITYSVRNAQKSFLKLKFSNRDQILGIMVNGKAVTPAMSSEYNIEKNNKIMLVPLIQAWEQNQEHNISPGTYIVQPGDTLSGIANNFLQAADRYREIMQLNNISSASNLQIGMKLQLPSMEDANKPIKELPFIVELAYSTSHDALCWLNGIDIELPGVDVEVLDYDWIVYTPNDFLAYNSESSFTSLGGSTFYRNLRSFASNSYNSLFAGEERYKYKNKDFRIEENIKERFSAKQDMLDDYYARGKAQVPMLIPTLPDFITYNHKLIPGDLAIRKLQLSFVHNNVINIFNVILSILWLIVMLFIFLRMLMKGWKAILNLPIIIVILILFGVGIGSMVFSEVGFNIMELCTQWTLFGYVTLALVKLIAGIRQMLKINEIHLVFNMLLLSLLSIFWIINVIIITTPIISTMFLLGTFIILQLSFFFQQYSLAKHENKNHGNPSTQEETQ